MFREAVQGLEEDGLEGVIVDIGGCQVHWDIGGSPRTRQECLQLPHMAFPGLQRIDPVVQMPFLIHDDDQYFNSISTLRTHLSIWQ
jgi:hypothetical protein